MWPATFYHPGAFLHVDFGDQYPYRSNATSKVATARGRLTLTGWEKYAERLPNKPLDDEKILRTTIREWYSSSDGEREAVYDGPTLILVPDPTPSTPTATSSSTSAPESGKVYKPGEIAGLGIGAFCGLVVLTALIYHYCARCVIFCCSPGSAERNRVRAAERRREQRDQEAGNADIDVSEADAAREAARKGPVRPGGVWVSRSDWPATPTRAARPTSESSRQAADDEIRVVASQARLDDQAVQDIRWAEQRRIEQERVEEMWREEARVAERRVEHIPTAEEGGPPPYEAPPPRYVP